MRILVLSNLYPPHSIGGYEQACFDVVEGLRSRGHRVDVVTSRYGIAAPTSASGIHRVLRLDPYWAPDDAAADQTKPATSRQRLRLSSLASWQRSAEALGRTCYRNLAGARTLTSLMKATHPDVLYIWNMRALPASLLSLAYRSGIPMIVNLQDHWLLEKVPGDRWLSLWERSPRSPLSRAARSALRPIVDPVIPTRLPPLCEANAHHVSHAFAAFYAGKGWRFSRERVIYNGLDLRLFPPRTRAHTGGEPHRLLFLGRLSPEKGAHVAIGATALLARQLGKKAVTLTIAGTATDTAYLERLCHMVHDDDLDDLVVFRGAVAHDMTTALYADHDVFLFPSNWHESFGLVLAEALACGLPVVGTTPGGSAEILEDEVSGLVVPPEDAAALARQVRRLIDDPALARRLSDAGAAMVRQRFDRHCIIEQIEQYLRDVIDDAARIADPASVRRGSTCV